MSVKHSRTHFVFTKHLQNVFFHADFPKLCAFNAGVTENLERSVHRKSKIPDKAQPPPVSSLSQESLSVSAQGGFPWQSLTHRGAVRFCKNMESQQDWSEGCG